MHIVIQYAFASTGRHSYVSIRSRAFCDNSIISRNGLRDSRSWVSFAEEFLESSLRL